MVNCELKFDNNPNGIYYSGQTLSGVVEFYNEKTRKIRGVSLRIEGLAKVRTQNSFDCVTIFKLSITLSVNGQKAKARASTDERFNTAAEKTTWIHSHI